jgi:hypothetical protein
MSNFAVNYFRLCISVKYKINLRPSQHLCQIILLNLLNIIQISLQIIDCQLIVKIFCDPAGIRTQDPYIKSVMLYQLSYGIIFFWECKNTLKYIHAKF